MEINNHVGNVHIKLDADHLNNKIKVAQIALNMQIVADSEPYVPFRQGALRSSVRYPKGIDGGEIEYNTPYAHYLYMGEVYGPNIPKKDAQGNIIGWMSPPSKRPTGRRLQYSKAPHPEAGAEWFERAKAQHLPDWTRLVKRTVGDG